METHTLPAPWPVIGHDWATDMLRHAIARGRPPHALLFTGPPSVGKGTLARSVAQTLLCTETPTPCGACRACRLVSQGIHPDLYWVEPEGNSLKVDQVRELTRQLALAPVEAAWQVAVLDRFELATTGAANALLKTLEEPPPTVVLVLLAQQAEALLPTIVSRCQVVPLRPLPPTEVEQALVTHWQADVKQAHLLSHLCGGRLGWAVTAATTPALLEQRQQKLDELVNLLHGKRVGRFAYANTLARQPLENILETLELWSGWWRDVLLLAHQSPVPLTNLDRHDEIQHVADRCGSVAARNALRALQAATAQLLRNANGRLVLEVLLLALPFLP